MSAVTARSRAQMGPRFECSVSRGTKVVRVSPEGYLDEECEFPDLAVQAGDVIEVDFARLYGMDTAGVMIWQRFWAVYTHQTFRLKNCPEFIVKYANFIPDFLPPNVEVTSFDVKFRCEDCNGTAMIPFHRDKHFAVWDGGYGRLYNSDQVQVCECGSRRRPRMVETESKYLEFLKRTRG